MFLISKDLEKIKFQDWFQIFYIKNKKIEFKMKWILINLELPSSQLFPSCPPCKNNLDPTAEVVWLFLKVGYSPEILHSSQLLLIKSNI